MKINENFLLREVAGNTIVVPVGEAAEKFNGMVKLNETGIFLWRALQQETNEAEVTEALCQEYEVDEATAKKDVAAFIQLLHNAGILQE